MENIIDDLDFDFSIPREELLQKLKNKQKRKTKGQQTKLNDIAQLPEIFDLLKSGDKDIMEIIKSQISSSNFDTKQIEKKIKTLRRKSKKNEKNTL